MWHKVKRLIYYHLFFSAGYDRDGVFFWHFSKPTVLDFLWAVVLVLAFLNLMSYFILGTFGAM